LPGLSFTRPRKRGNNLPKNLTRVVDYILVLLIMAAVLFPVFWLVSSSFKPAHEWFAKPPVWISNSMTLDNYKVLIYPVESISRMGGFSTPAVKPIVNSLIIAIFATVIATVAGFLAAYSISRYQTGGAQLFIFILQTRMLPPIAIAIPLLLMYSTLGLVDRHIGLIIMYAGVTLSYVVWMMKGFIDEIPVEIEEAAILEGYSEWEILFRVIFPLVRGPLLASGLFVLILNWGEFLFALIFTHSEAFTVPVQLQKYFSNMGLMLGPVSALSVLATIPVVILGYLIQKHFVRGITFGAVKGGK
jgi:multiple sugar transport system permease protein